LYPVLIRRERNDADYEGIHSKYYDMIVSKLENTDISELKRSGLISENEKLNNIKVFYF
jgi:hypothetical protein